MVEVSDISSTFFQWKRIFMRTSDHDSMAAWVKAVMRGEWPVTSPPRGSLYPTANIAHLVAASKSHFSLPRLQTKDPPLSLARASILWSTRAQTTRILAWT